MTLNYKACKGSQLDQPEAVDTTSSKTVVYLRKNIEQVEETDPMTEETYTMWSYDEATLSHSDYATYLAEEAFAKTDYVAMMSGIDFEEV